MISQFNYRRLTLLGLTIFLIFIIYHVYFRIHAHDAALVPVRWQELVHDGVGAFTRLRFVKEDDVLPFDSFTKEHVYTGNSQVYHEVALPWTPLEEKNREDVIAMALEQSKAVTGGAVTSVEFQHGLRRWLPGVGEEYALVFRSGDDVYVAQLYRKLEGPLVAMTRATALRKQLLHIVMPLSGRVHRLKVFLDMLGRLIDDGENIQLTVAAFSDGPNGTRPVEVALRDWRHAARAHLVTEPGAFSRGRALLRGAAAAGADNTDPLLFFCDVDMQVSARELEKCRVHTQRGYTVYYPVVFSRFNWRLAAALEQWPQWLGERQQRVSRSSGEWRDYGFGMSCHYYSDLVAVSDGFAATEGWGGEDVALYRRFIQRYRVVRAFDPDLQHLYHPKKCDEGLPEDQYRGCVLSKIRNEGSKEQLGMLALGRTGELAPRGYDMLRVWWTHLPAGWAAIALAVMLVASVMLNVYQFRRQTHGF